MRHSNPRRFAVMWGASVVVFLAVSFMAAFYLTNFIYSLIHVALAPVLIQVINAFLGLIFTALIISAFSRYFRRQQINAFTPILQAMERIAQGDFSIRLEDEPADSILNNLVKSVNKMALELGQVENMRQEFISNVSHEIQSPLTSIRGFAQALQDDTLSPADRQHYLEIIQSESQRLSRLSEDLLNLASLESEQLKFEPKTYRLDQQIRRIMLTCEPQWRQKELTVEADLVPVTICADEDLLSQVWTNLIHNSIKFTPLGGTIHADLQASGGRIEVRLSDTGIGILPEDQVHIFERFYKADRSRTPSRGGSGLGLSIAKKIVELHKGWIELESQAGRGTTFIVSLPSTGTPG